MARYIGAAALAFILALMLAAHLDNHNLLASVPDWGTIPQWLTALIAAGAFGAAIWSVNSQREIARKRAAIDFFTKTEMDKETLEAHKKYTEAVAALRAHQEGGKYFGEFVKTESYQHIRGYLNLHELMAVGINQEVLDNDVCYEFWSGELRRSYKDTKTLIEHIQSQDDEKYTYCELVEVTKNWADRENAERLATG